MTAPTSSTPTPDAPGAADGPAGGRRRQVLVGVPLVLGLVAALGLLAWRHAEEPPAWCGRVRAAAEVVAASVDGGDDLDPRALGRALAELDVDALVADLPADLAAEVRPARAGWPALVAALTGRPPPAGAPATSETIAAFTAIVERYDRDCRSD